MSRQRSPFRDELRARHVCLIAAAFGFRRAEVLTGVSRSQISAWRKRLAELDGSTYPNRPNPGNTGHGKLTPAVLAQVRARRAAGVSSGVLARIHQVHPVTIRRRGAGA